MKPSKKDRVGSSFNTKVSTPTATPAPSPTPKASVTKKPALGAFNATSVLDAFKKATGVDLSSSKAANVGSGDALINSLSMPQKTSLIKLLKKLGKNVQGVAELKTTLNGYYPNEYNASNSYDSLYVALAADYIPGSETSSATTTGIKSNGVTQYVTKKDPKLIAQLIDDTLLSTIGSRVIDPASRKKLEGIINDMIKAGTTVTTKMDKTGKTTVTQTAGYSDAAAQAAIAEQAKILSPKDYERQQGLSFFDWMQKAESMRGGR